MYGLREQDVTKISNSGELSQTSSPRMDEEMVGFKDEEEKLIEHLVLGSKQLQIVSIVGMPGLGKTFLTRKVHNNPIIKDYFYIRAWCYVSQAYERKDLLINILSQIKKFTEEMSKMTDEDLAAELKRSLLGQKYLIVLDDMWDIEAWDALRRSFPDDNTGNRIVFTSRFSRLALQARPDSKIHKLRPFSEGESWELLQKKIFRTESCPSDLVEIGQQIAQRCHGLPLAIVVVGGLLARAGKAPARWAWEEVADSLSSYIIGDPQRQCLDILDLSYKSLPDYLKPCFLYLGAFPEDKEIHVVKLTRLWIAEGFVPKNDPNLGYIAEGYFMELIDRSLVIASKWRSTSGVKTCRVHDLIREFCLAKAQEENFLQLIEGSRDSLAASTSARSNISFSYSISYLQNRLCVHYRPQGKRTWFNSSSPCIRSLLFFAPRRVHFSSYEVSSILHGFKLLRVLDLMCIHLGHTFPQGIDSLAHLRYLAISGDFLLLPLSLAKLENLQTFLARAIRFEVSLYTILSMTKLRHLHLDNYEKGSQSSYCFSHVLSSHDSSELDSLQTLSTPVLSYGDDMKIMRRFPNLKKLSCEFKGSWDSTTNRLPVLDFLNQLESLKVSYIGVMRHPCELISLPSNIKKLTMSWFRLPWEQISIIGKLPNLEVLKLLSKAFEGEEWDIQDGEFPKLKFLKLECLDIRRWIASDDYFPPLEQLILERCFELEEIPSCLEEIPTLKMIIVEECNNSLDASIKQIQEEQRDFGNEELKIEIKRYKRLA